MSVSESRITPRHWLRHLPALTILIVFVLPLPGWLSPGEGMPSQIGREGVFWAMALVLLLWVRIIERRPWLLIGLRRPNGMTLVSGVGAAVVMIAGMAFIYLVVFPVLGEKESAAKLGVLTALPVALRAAIVLRAAVFEELFYRGFAIERLAELTNRRWLAAAVSWAAFTLAHLGYWGVGHLLVAGFGGAVLTALYLWRRDLVANGLAHLLTDGVGILLS